MKKEIKVITSWDYINNESLSEATLSMNGDQTSINFIIELLKNRQGIQVIE